MNSCGRVKRDPNKKDQPLPIIVQHQFLWRHDNKPPLVMGLEEWMVGLNKVSDFAFSLAEMKAKSSVSDHEDYKFAEGESVKACLLWDLSPSSNKGR